MTTTHPSPARAHQGPGPISVEAKTRDGIKNDPGPVELAIRDIAPFALSLIPFALAIGSAGAANGMALTTTLFGAGAILAGASQLAAIELLGSGAGTVLVVSTVALINARLLLYGNGVNRWFPTMARWQRLLLAGFIVDANYLICEQRFETLRAEADRRRYYLAATMAMILVFFGCQVIGHQAGATVPDGMGLHLAAPLVFAGMLAQTVTDRTHLITAATATVVLIGATTGIGGAALPLATVVALGAGTMVGNRPSIDEAAAATDPSPTPDSSNDRTDS